MSSLIESLWGKRSGITPAELRSVLVGRQEDDMLEAKTIPTAAGTSGGAKLSGSERHIHSAWGVNELVISPAVAFLNKEDGSGGLLVLGATAPSGEIVGLEPVPDGELDKVEVAVSDRIGTTSYSPTRPEVLIVRVQETPGFSVSLVEVHPTDPLVLYYSKISSLCYRREGDESRRLPLEEVVQLVRAKRMARISLEFPGHRLEGEDFSTRMRLTNSGNMPGKFVSVLIILPSYPSPDKVTLVGDGIKDVTSVNHGAAKAFQTFAGYPPNTSFVYPSVGVAIGELRVRDFLDGATLGLRIQICEDNGRTDLSLEVRRSGAQCSVSTLAMDFRPY
jgi:hypothetical protein